MIVEKKKDSPVHNLELETIQNDNFRKVITTTNKMQLVVMSLKPNEDIGEEMHPATDQFFRIEKGTAKVILDGKEFIMREGASVIVQAGTKHNIINMDQKPLKLYSIYTPPEHPANTIEKDKPGEK